MSAHRMPLRHVAIQVNSSYLICVRSFQCHYLSFDNDKNKHSRCEVIMSIAKSLIWMTCLDAPFNIKKLLDSEIFEIEYICSTLIWKVNFGSQKHLLIWELEGSLLYEVCNYTL